MKSFISKKGTLEELKQGLSQFENDPDIKSMFVLGCDANNFTAENCNSILLGLNKKVWGGIFPAIINGKEKLDKGTIILGIKSPIEVTTLTQVSSLDTNFDDKLENFFDDSFSFNTVGVIVDGFSQRISALLDSLFLIVGLDFNYIGGGAGSLSMQQKPCIISNKGLLKDAALIVGLQLESNIGMQHGWKSISGPFKVTESDRNIVKSIDYKPAFEVFKSIVEKHSNRHLTEKNFFEIAKAYPFGINKLGAEKVVRDPITSEYGNLNCVGELPEGTFIDILNGNKDSLLEAARSVRKQVNEKINNKPRLFELFFDCISRVLFLEDDFALELEAVINEDTPLFGALSIGEIANNQKDYLEFYNKTAVLASFKK